MPVNRRSFLKSGAMSVLTTAVTFGFVSTARGQGKPTPPAKESPTPRTGAEVPSGAEQSPLFYFTRETFEPYVGGVFIARAGRNSVEMKLLRVRDCTPKSTKLVKGTAPKTDCFALEFSSDGTLTDLTSVYDVRHAALAEFPLFLTRRDGPDGTNFYEAVFNHVR